MLNPFSHFLGQAGDTLPIHRRNKIISHIVYLGEEERDQWPDFCYQCCPATRPRQIRDRPGEGWQPKCDTTSRLPLPENPTYESQLSAAENELRSFVVCWHPEHPPANSDGHCEESDPDGIQPNDPRTPNHRTDNRGHGSYVHH